jgi:hypothetical protein
MKKQEIDELIEKWTAYALDEGRRSDIKSAIRHALEEYSIMRADENSVSQHVSNRRELLVAFMKHLRNEYGEDALPMKNNYTVERFLGSN